jgi:hypothetical protein
MPDLDLSAGFITPAPRKTKRSRLDDLITFAKEHKLTVGSTTGGRHNRGSKHYSGNAIDIRGSGNFDDARVNQLKQAAAERGLLVRDERRRPPRQKVWGGPHLHVEAADIDLRGGLDTPQQIDLSAGFEDQGQTPPPTETVNTQTPATTPPRQQSVPVDNWEPQAIRDQRKLFDAPQQPVRKRPLSQLATAGVQGVDPWKPQGLHQQERLFWPPVQTDVMSAAPPQGALSRLKDAALEYMPGIRSLDTPAGVKMDAPRGFLRGVSIGALGESRPITQEDLLVDPEAETRRDVAEMAGETVGAVVPYVGTAKALTTIPRLARPTVAAHVARNALTFGGVEAAREGIHAAKTGESVQPAEIAISTGIGAAMGGIAGVSPSMKRQVVAFLTPGVAVDVARGTPPEQAIQNALTNLGFALTSGAKGPTEAQLRARMRVRPSEPEVVQRPRPIEQRGEPEVVERVEPAAAPAVVPPAVEAAERRQIRREFERIREGEKDVQIEPQATTQVSTAEASPTVDVSRIPTAAAIPPAVKAAERRQVRREFSRIKEREDARAIEAQSMESRTTAPERQPITDREAPVETTAVRSEAAAPELPQRFQHLQFGEVTATGNQSGVPRGRVRVMDAEGVEHVIQKPKGTGAGNQYAVPIRTLVTSGVRRVPFQEVVDTWRQLREGSISKTQLPIKDFPYGESPNWVEARIPLRDLTSDWNRPSPFRDMRLEEAAQYATRTTDLPPGIGKLDKTGSGIELQDGNRRAIAAQSRGEDSLRMLIPEADYNTYLKSRDARTATAQPAETSLGEQATTPQRVPDTGRISAEGLSDIVESPAFREQGLRGLDIPTQRVVLSRMLSAIHDPQVRKRVVELVPVDVVNRLINVKSPSQVLLHDPAVLPVEFAFNPNGSISVRMDVADALLRTVSVPARNAAKGTEVLSDLGESSVGESSTSRTSNITSRSQAHTTILPQSAESPARMSAGKPLVPAEKEAVRPARPQPLSPAEAQVESQQPSPQGEVVKPPKEVIPSEATASLAESSQPKSFDVGKAEAAPNKPITTSAVSSQSVEYNNRTYTKQPDGSWLRGDGRKVVGRVEKQLNELAAKGKPPTETITPAEDASVGTNDAGEQLYERADGSRYRMHRGRPDFGGDLAPVKASSEPSPVTPARERPPEPAVVASEPSNVKEPLNWREQAALDRTNAIVEMHGPDIAERQRIREENAREIESDREYRRSKYRQLVAELKRTQNWRLREDVVAQAKTTDIGREQVVKDLIDAGIPREDAVGATQTIKSAAPKSGPAIAAPAPKPSSVTEPPKNAAPKPEIAALREVRVELKEAYAAHRKRLNDVNEEWRQLNINAPKWLDNEARRVFGKERSELSRQQFQQLSADLTRKQKALSKEQGDLEEMKAESGNPLVKRVIDASLRESTLLKELESQGAAEPTAVLSARERKAKRTAEKKEGIEYRRSGADPIELIDNITIRGWELYSEKVKPTFDEWAQRVRKEFGTASDPHLRTVWKQLGGESELTPPRPTAPKDAAMVADRESLGLPELERLPTVSAEEVLTKAKAANTADPRAPNILIEQALKGGKNFTNVETMQVNLRAQEIKNRHESLMKEIYESKDDAAIANKAVEAEALLNEFGRLSEGMDVAGAEWSRAGHARQRAINEDYSLVAMAARMKAAKRGELTPKERSTIDTLHQQLTAAEARAEAAEAKAAQNRAAQQIEKVRRQRTRAESKEALDREAVVIKSSIAAELARLRSQSTQASGLAGIDPEGRLTKELIRYVHNRAKANVGLKAEALIDEAHTLISDLGVSRRQVAEALVGYGDTPKQRSAAAKRVAEVNSEINRLLQSEDVAAGRRSPRQEGPKREFSRNQTRLKQLEKEKADLERRMVEGDFVPPQREPPRYTKETLAAQKEVDTIKERYNRMRYKATRGRGGMITDELAKAANVGKTIKSIGDISAVFRQGGYYALTHPIEGGIKPTRAMLKSFTELGYKNVEAVIKNDPYYETLKKAGTEFTGVEKDNPNLSRREEGYLGQEYLQYVPVAKQVANFSERTFVSFLDAQRLYMGRQMIEGLTKLQQRDPAELKAISRLLNIGTGRGPLGKWGNSVAPALNIAMFSPRLLASRVQLLNNMINPVTIARMPAGARARMIKDNVKFLAGTFAVMQLAQAAGATVSLDPDDSEFLKIRFGNTVYDQLTGLQQPLRFIINMARAASPVDSETLQAGPEMFTGQHTAEQIKRFSRSKLNPGLSPAVDFFAGEDFMGRKFDAGRTAREFITPLPASDVIEAMQQEGLIASWWPPSIQFEKGAGAVAKGAAKATPSLVGIGVGSYPPAPEKPTTHAEKLARKFIRDAIPDDVRTEEKIETDKKKAELRARSRTGEDVTAEMDKLRLNEKERKAIEDAKGQTRLQQDVKRLSVKNAAAVYRVMTRSEKEQVRDILEDKINRMDEGDEKDELIKRLALTPRTTPRQPKAPVARRPRPPRQPRIQYQLQ